MNGARSAGILKVVLPIAAQKIPIARVARFEASGTLEPPGGLQASVMNGKSVANAEVGKEKGGGKGHDDKNPAVRGIGKAQNHCEERSDPVGVDARYSA